MEREQEYQKLQRQYRIMQGDREAFTEESQNLIRRQQSVSKFMEIEVPSRVDGKRRNLARVSDFVSWDEACRVPRHKITHECKIPPLSIHE